MKTDDKNFEYTPIDWALYVLVVYFNQIGFPTNEATLRGEVNLQSKDISSIFFREDRVQCDKLLLFLKEKLNKSEEIVSISRPQSGIVELCFENGNLYKIHDLLQLEMPDKDEAHRGGRGIDKCTIDKIIIPQN